MYVLGTSYLLIMRFYLQFRSFVFDFNNLPSSPLKENKCLTLIKMLSSYVYNIYHALSRRI